MADSTPPLAAGNHNERCRYCSNFIERARHTICNQCGKPNRLYVPADDSPGIGGESD